MFLWLAGARTHVLCKREHWSLVNVLIMYIESKMILHWKKKCTVALQKVTNTTYIPWIKMYRMYCSIFFWTKGYKHNVHFLNKVFRIQYFPEKKGLRHNNVLRTFPVQGIAFYLLNKMLKTKMHIPWVKMSINIVHLFL